MGLKRRQLLLFGGTLFSIGLLRKSPFAVAEKPEQHPLPTSKLSGDLKTFSFEVVTVNNRGQIINRKQNSADYFEQDLGNGVTLDMVMIPGGTFTMGSPSSEAWSYDTERPQREVTVPEFAMGRYEVTRAQWQAVMGTHPSRFTGDRRPVELVSWNNAVAFCEKLSEQTGQNYRLPSEAEWEYACRAGITTPFHFGETITTELANYSGTDLADSSGSYGEGPKGEYRGETTDVGSFPPNAFGLYDMHGNVWEWCEDSWHGNYEGAPVDGSAWISNVDWRIIRGGSWFNYPRNCRSAPRNRFYPGVRYHLSGFRLVLSLPRIS